jgi:phosphate transport system protein
MIPGERAMTRQNYEQQLHSLRQAIIAMSSMVDKAIARSVDALKQQDVGLAEQVVQEDRLINQARWDTEEQALLIIATQAPMARDLRVISGVIHIATELERMADHAAGNAKIVLQTADEPLLKPLVDIPRMGEACRSMLSDSITAFIEMDAVAARELVARDDDVDELYDQIYRELLTYMMADPATINRATHLLWAAHNLERIADRVTNICERVVFAVTGQLEEIGTATY